MMKFSVADLIFASHDMLSMNASSWTNLAPLLPITCSSLFIWQQIGKLRRHHVDVTHYGRPTPMLYSHWDSRSGDSILEIWNEHFAKTSIDVHNFFAFGMLVNHSQNYIISLASFCSLQAIALIILTAQSGPDRMPPSLVTAIGWILLSFNEQLDTGTSVTTAYLALFTAILCLCFLKRALSAHQWRSGTFLILLALSRSLFVSPVLRQWTSEHSRVYGISMCGISMCGIHDLMAIPTRRVSGISRASFADHAQRLIFWFLRFTLSVLAVFLPAATGAIATGFLVSCLAWQSVLFEDQITGPFMNTENMSVGVMLFLISWMIAMSWKDPAHKAERRKPIALLQHHAWLCVNLIGFTSTVLSSLWVLLMIGMSVHTRQASEQPRHDAMS
jgi:hypothetical protein